YRFRENGRLCERTMIARDETDPRTCLSGFSDLAKQIAQHEKVSSVVIITFIELYPKPGEKLIAGMRAFSHHDSDVLFKRILNQAQMIAMRYPDDIELFELVAQLTHYKKNLNE
ncbi:MAG: hypothetical protein KGL58_08945, partial [Pseudomonadota bacterium]|nr:hypothetical protein [Pseudomonadota bacterium]